MHTLKVNFEDEDMEKIRAIAEEHGVIPAQLVQEVTEAFLDERITPPVEIIK